MRFFASLIFIGFLATAANSDVTSRNGGPTNSQMLSKGVTEALMVSLSFAQS